MKPSFLFREVFVQAGKTSIYMQKPAREQGRRAQLHQLLRRSCPLSHANYVLQSKELSKHPVKLFHDFRLDTTNHSLWRVDERVQLAPKTFDVLRFLVENAGHLISHDDLLDAIWPDTYVNPEILRKYILEIRKALGDVPKAPMFIETHAKRGYRFIAPVVDLLRPCTGRRRVVDQPKPYLIDNDIDRRKIILITAESGCGNDELIKPVARELLDTKLNRLLTEITETIAALTTQQTFVLMINNNSNAIPPTPDLITIAEQ